MPHRSDIIGLGENMANVLVKVETVNESMVVLVYIVFPRQIFVFFNGFALPQIISSFCKRIAPHKRTMESHLRKVL